MCSRCEYGILITCDHLSNERSVRARDRLMKIAGDVRVAHALLPLHCTATTTTTWHTPSVRTRERKRVYSPVYRTQEVHARTRFCKTFSSSQQSVHRTLHQQQRYAGRAVGVRALT